MKQSDSIFHVRNEKDMVHEDAKEILKGVLPPNFTDPSHPFNSSQCAPSRKHGPRMPTQRPARHTTPTSIRFVPASGAATTATSENRHTSEPEANIKRRQFSEVAPPSKPKDDDRKTETTRPHPLERESTPGLDVKCDGKWAWSTGRPKT
jgi:hypothetical protein